MRGAAGCKGSGSEHERERVVVVGGGRAIGRAGKRTGGRKVGEQPRPRAQCVRGCVHVPGI